MPARASGLPRLAASHSHVVGRALSEDSELAAELRLLGQVADFTALDGDVIPEIRLVSGDVLPLVLEPDDGIGRREPIGPRSPPGKRLCSTVRTFSRSIMRISAAPDGRLSRKRGPSPRATARRPPSAWRPLPGLGSRMTPCGTQAGCQPDAGRNGRYSSLRGCPALRASRPGLADSRRSRRVFVEAAASCAGQTAGGHRT